MLNTKNVHVHEICSCEFQCRLGQYIYKYQMSLKVRTKTFYRLQHFNRTLLLSTLYDILINGYDWRLGPTEEILIGDVE